jgi:hypothetical protein
MDLECKYNRAVNNTQFLIKLFAYNECTSIIEPHPTTNIHIQLRKMYLECKGKRAVHNTEFNSKIISVLRVHNLKIKLLGYYECIIL